MKNHLRRIKLMLLGAACALVFINYLIAARGSSAAVGPWQKHKPDLPPAIPADVWEMLIPEDNPMTEAKVARGRDLYFDKRLSSANSVSGFSEPGRFLVTRQPKDVGAFKTSPLRDIELTAPYMHDGSLKTLGEVIEFYNKGGEPNPNLDGGMRALELTAAEIGDLETFLKALTSQRVQRLVKGEEKLGMVNSNWA